LGENEIICSCPITTTHKGAKVGYQIAGPYPCRQSFFDNCKRTMDNSQTGSTIHVGSPTGVGDLLAFLLTGSVPRHNKCFSQGD
jgi:hypothetical protein